MLRSTEKWEVSKFGPYWYVLKISWEKAKDTARDILLSNLLVYDILIDEAWISWAVRKIFKQRFALIPNKILMSNFQMTKPSYENTK